MSKTEEKGLANKPETIHAWTQEMNGYGDTHNYWDEDDEYFNYLRKDLVVRKEDIRTLLKTSWDNKRTRYENILEGLESLLNGEMADE